MMSTRALIVALLAALAAAGWYFRDSAPVSGLVRDAGKMAGAIPLEKPVRVDKSGAEKSAAGKAAGVLRKCVAGEKVTYTDEKCPPGSRESPISGGNVTVLPAQRGTPAGEDTAGKAAGAASEPARVKDELNMREKRMEQTVNR